jgi:hypothetical protein
MHRATDGPYFERRKMYWIKKIIVRIFCSPFYVVVKKDGLGGNKVEGRLFDNSKEAFDFLHEKNGKDGPLLGFIGIDRAVVAVWMIK